MCQMTLRESCFLSKVRATSQESGGLVREALGSLGVVKVAPLGGQSFCKLQNTLLFPRGSQI